MYRVDEAHDTLEICDRHFISKLFVHVLRRPQTYGANVANQRLELAEVFKLLHPHRGANGVAGKIADTDRGLGSPIPNGYRGNSGLLLVTVHQQHFIIFAGLVDKV